MDDSKIGQSESAKKNERMMKSGSAEFQPLAAYAISFILMRMGRESHMRMSMYSDLIPSLSRRNHLDMES